MTLRTDLEASMRERIARTITSHLNGHGFGWQANLDVASAVLNELAEPDEVAINAAMRGSTDERHRRTIIAIWKAMVEAMK